MLILFDRQVVIWDLLVTLLTDSTCSILISGGMKTGGSGVETEDSTWAAEWSAPE